jgi:hypothetical protein
MPKVKIRLLQGYSGSLDGHYETRAGDVIEVEEGTAKDLCERADGQHRAEYVREPKKQSRKRTSQKRETADVKPDETADEQ